MSELLKLLLGFLRPGIEGDDTVPGGDDTVPGGEGEETQEGGEGEDTLDAAGGDDNLFGDEPDEDKPPKKTDAEQLAEERERRIRAEAIAEEARRHGGAAAPAMDSQDARLRADEDRRLADSKTSELEKWQINTNRSLRERDARDRQTQAMVLDSADRTRFDLLATTKPQIHKRYAERVENELTRMRQNGQNAPREAILRFLVGQDALEGKFTPRKAAAAPGRGTTLTPGARGARSDVATKGKLTESQKREARLANQLI